MTSDSFAEARDMELDRQLLGRPRLRPVLTWLIIGAIVGAALGAFYGESKKPSYQAVVVMSILPEDSVTAQTVGDTTASSQDSTVFIQSELIVLNGRPLLQQVQDQLKLSSLPNVSSRQVGQTYVVDVTATAPTTASALAIAKSLTQLYAAQRRAALNSDVQGALKTVQAQLASVAGSLKSLQPTTTAATALSNQVTALQAEYARLLAVNSSLELSLAQLTRAVTLIQQPTITSAGSLSDTAKFGVAGGLLGVILAGGLFLVYRRVVPRIDGAADLGGLGVPVLLPEVPRGLVPKRAYRAPGVVAASITLAARLTANDPASPAVVVVIGASRGAGTSFIAGALARSMARRGPVLLVRATDHRLDGSRSRSAKAGDRIEEPQWVFDPSALLERSTPSKFDGVRLLSFQPSYAETGGNILVQLRDGLFASAAAASLSIVIDAPSLNVSDLAIAAAQAGGHAVVVVGRGLSKPLEVATTVDVLLARGVHVAGVVVNSPTRAGRRFRRRDPLTSLVPAARPGSWAAQPSGSSLNGLNGFVKPTRSERSTARTNTAAASAAGSRHRAIAQQRRLANSDGARNGSPTGARSETRLELPE